MAMTGVAIYLNRRSLAAAMLLGFTAYLRPSELVELTPATFVPPQTRVDSRLKYWAVIVRPLELGIPAKTTDFDESVVLGSPHLEWFGEVFQVLRHRPHDQRVWPFDLMEYGQQLSEIAVLAGVSCLQVEPYSLRHRGASHDSLMQYRTLTGIEERGRWKADSSVLRYKKAARALQRIGLLSSDVLDYGGLFEKNLQSLFLGKIHAIAAADAGARARALLKSTKQHHAHRVCFDLFSGVGHVSKSWQQHGFAVLTFDINDGWDFTDCKLLGTILGWTRSGIIIAMALGPPCSSWSMAMRCVARAGRSACARFIKGLAWIARKVSP